MGIGDWFKRRKPVDRGAPSEPSAAAALPPGFGNLLVQLLFDGEPRFNAQQILDRIRTRRTVTELVGNTDGRALLFAHPDHTAFFQGDNSLPSQTVVLAPDTPPRLPDAIRESMGQTWEWPDAAQEVARCAHVLVVSEMMSMTLPPLERVKVFVETLAGVVEALQPRALNWVPTQRLMNPTAFIADVDSRNEDRRRRTALNVRLFNVQGAEGEVVMDSLGLALLGLPDVQVHARGMDVGHLGAHLYNSALYLLANGDVVEDGNTIEGLTPGQRWRCQHEEALLKPKRVVLDIDPGPPHAAGKRAWMK